MAPTGHDSAQPSPPRRGWLHREAQWARSARRRRREWATAREIDLVTHAEPPEPVHLPLVELVRFWAWPLVAILGASVLGIVLVLSAGLARNLGVSMLAGVVAAVVVVPTQVVLARRAAQVEFERDGQLVQLAVDRVLEEVESMLDRRAESNGDDDRDAPAVDSVESSADDGVEGSDTLAAGPGPDVGAGP